MQTLYRSRCFLHHVLFKIKNNSSNLTEQYYCYVREFNCEQIRSSLVIVQLNRIKEVRCLSEWQRGIEPLSCTHHWDRNLVYMLHLLERWVRQKLKGGDRKNFGVCPSTTTHDGFSMKSKKLFKCSWWRFAEQWYDLKL